MWYKEGAFIHSFTNKCLLPLILLVKRIVTSPFSGLHTLLENQLAYT